MKNPILITDFTFTFNGHGHYKVTYASPIARREWSMITDDMPLIDATKNSENPKKKDLIILKNRCKS